MSIANIIYVLRKELNNEKIQDIVLTISSILTIVDLSKNDIYNDTLLNFNDFEDAIKAAQMKKIKDDYLITRNLKDYVNSDLKIFLQKILLIIFINKILN